MKATRKLLSTNTTNKIHFWLIALMLIGIVGSKFLMSITMMLCVANLLLEADFKNYWQRIINNRLLHLLIAFYLLHAISLLWSDNISYGLNDLRIKAPLFVVSIILIAKPIIKSDHAKLYLLLILSLLVTSVINFCHYQFLLNAHLAKDIRELSLFGSHIRYGILLAMGIGICLFLCREFKRFSIGLISCAAWFMFYTYYSQILSGILSLLVVFILYAILYFREKKWVLISGGLICLTLLMVTIGFLFSNEKEIISPISQSSELKDAWNKRSSISFDSLDLKRQPLQITLTRYLASKDLLPNKNGVNELDEDDVHNIENGFADIRETGFGFSARLYGLRYQIHHAGNPNGHSLLQRIESWKTAGQIIKENWIFGVGAGDVADIFEQKYKENKSLLIAENRIRAHNSFLTYWLSFGVVGLILFSYIQYSLFQVEWRNVNYLGLLFIGLSLISFLLEDALETQTGVTFFTFFYSFYASKDTSLKTN